MASRNQATDLQPEEGSAGRRLSTRSRKPAPKVAECTSAGLKHVVQQCLHGKLVVVHQEYMNENWKVC